MRKRILWNNTVLLLSISKKLPFNPFFFVKLKYRWNRMWLSLFIYLFSTIFIFTPILWCCYCSLYSSFYTNSITSPCCRVLPLLLLKRPSQLVCCHCVLYWLSNLFALWSVFYHITSTPIRGVVSSSFQWYLLLYSLSTYISLM